MSLNPENSSDEKSRSGRVLIVNADDLGLAKCVNRGIERAYRQGILTSSTLMANGPEFENGVQIAQGNPHLGIGVHLNIVRGKPVSPPERIGPLLGNGNLFRGRINCADKYFMAAAETEYRAQIEKILAAGIKPTHLDFEKHHGRRAPLYNLACRLSEDYSINAIRNLCEPVAFGLRKLPWPGIEKALDAAMLRTAVTLSGYKKQPVRPKYFFGQLHIGAVGEELLLALAACLPEGISELMCHPGEYDPEELGNLRAEIGDSWIHQCRPGELAALTGEKVKAAYEESGIRLANFSSLK